MEMVKMVKEKNEQIILDACCGSRMFWFNKKHPNTIYIDIRKEEKGFIDNREKREVNPDIIMDFRKMSFPDKSFKLVIWDPPHMIRGGIIKDRMTKTYGALNPETWQDDLTKGFNECWRVLEDYGVLIFKWSDTNRWGQNTNINRILKLFPIEPLIAQKVKWTKENQYATHWATFMKIPKGKL